MSIQGCPTVSTSVLSMDLKILFKPDKYDVSPLFYGQIKRLADFLIAHPDTKVSVEGYTDNVGDNERNLALSKNRASAITDILVQKFKIAQNRVKAVGFGESNPIAENDTPEGRAKNRRVIAEVYAEKTQSLRKWTIYSVDEDIK
ncbi:OmpA family protein [Marinomonas flavescens]|uniref:OmpA family protein n=1 Tax=Marinomonas flavescens TaxID=2529379 RepID=UPI001F0A0AE5|nr:OmpA family protein [Marinomonas flavescens]